MRKDFLCIDPLITNAHFKINNINFRFNHRNDYNAATGKNQNALFVREDIVHRYNVVQL